MDEVLIEHNFTGLGNQSMNNLSTEYYYDYSDLAAGTYVWKSYANDTVGNNNQTDQWEYVVSKASSLVNLTLNATDGNYTINQGESVNISARLIIPAAGYIELYQDNVLINSGTDSLENISLYPDVGEYNITLIYPETQNYTYSYESHYITVLDNVAPNISLESPDNGTLNPQNVTFEYSVVDADSEIANCSLIIDGTVNITNSTVNESIIQDFFVPGLVVGNHTWRIDCIDDSVNANLGTSETRNITITNCIDNDGDGSWLGGCLPADCDDNNSAINPGAAEVCDNSIDDNCDGQVDEGCAAPPPSGGGGGEEPPEEPPEEEIPPEEEPIEPEEIVITPEGEEEGLLTPEQVLEIKENTEIRYATTKPEGGVVGDISQVLRTTNITIGFTNTGNKTLKNIKIVIEQPEVEKEANILHPTKIWGWDIIRLTGWISKGTKGDLSLLEWKISEPKQYDILRPGESIDIDIDVIAPLTKLSQIGRASCRERV